LALSRTGGSQEPIPAESPTSADRLEKYLADLKNPVGDEASTLGGPQMVEIRVSVADGTDALLLMQRLAGVFDARAISFDALRDEVRVTADWESRAATAVVEVFEAWLKEDGAESARFSVGDRRYTLRASTPLAVSG
jgi:hypothetical protein